MLGLAKHNFVSAYKSLDVVINEVCWMGTKASHSDEWIELYNNSDADINLDGWVLKANDKSPEIELMGIILGKSFYILERTDDDSAAEISADIIYKGALNNKGEILELFDGDKNLIDKVDCGKGWFAGDNKTKQTMEKLVEVGLQQAHWQTSQEPGGTPKTKNSDGDAMEAEPPMEVRPQSEPPQSEHYPSGIIINEILASPEGPDAENEWIEIFNENNFDTDISGWKISDTVGGVKSYAFPIGTKIPGKEFLVLERPETKITLNNNGDGLKIFNPNGKIVDEINFEKATLGQSYNKFESEWQWSENLTPGAVNSSGKHTESEFLLDGSSEARISQGFKQLYENSSRRMAVVIALIIAFCSAIIILILKKNLKSN